MANCNTADITLRTSGSLTDQSAINKLSSGFLALYQPELKKVKQQLDELTMKQSSLIGQLQEENKKFFETQTSNELQEMFLIVKQYQTRLMNVKKEMTNLHERTTKLKKRALRLQQMKQKEALQRQHQLQQEQELIAKPSTTNRT